MKSQLLLKPENARMPTFSLVNGSFVLGRSSKCDLIVRHESVSRQHAGIAVTRTTVRIHDLGSRNGTFIDNDRVETAVLKLRQVVRFGSVTFLLADAGLLDGSDSEVETAKCELLSASPEMAAANLSKAQNRVLVLLLQGLPEKQVARQLKISRTTVHNHVQAIYQVFKVHSRPELLARLLAPNHRNS
jgi:DNA-binding CsgD family transcriptional regulator